MIHPGILLASGALSLGLALHVYRRKRTPGSGTFVWLLAGIALWCLSGAAHWAAPSIDAKVAWARVQYLGVAAVPALSLTFAIRFGRYGWASHASTTAFIWIIPALTIVAAWTNSLHGALWPSVTLREGGRAVYEHGWWFWVAAAHAYVLMLLSAILIAGALRRSPPPYRGQFVLLLGGAVMPWAGNLAYLAGWVPVEGLDLTPLMFTASGVLFTYALYRNHLFDLVPVARDQLVESLSDAVVVLDASRRVLDLNGGAKRLAAREGASLDAGWLGRPVEELMPFLHGAPIELAHAPTSSLVIDVPSFGAMRSYDARVTPVRAEGGAAAGEQEGGIVAWAVLLRDVTDQRRAQAEREALERRVQEQQKRESLSVLAGGLAHDFNNLLAGILGNADLLAMQVPRTGDMPAHVGAIILGAQRGADLVSKMLAYAGERHGAAESVNLDHLVREMLDLLQTSVARHCTLEYEGTPVEMFADPVQVRQVAMNLIINAAEAVEERDGVVHVHVGLELLSPRQLAGMQFGAEAMPGAYAFLDVRDNGPGIDEPTLRHIFTPFYTTKPRGHGLGLAAVQGIVRGHRGALRVETGPGQGARFRVWFPAAERALVQSTSASPASPSFIT